MIFFKKRKQKLQKLDEREGFLDDTILKSTTIQGANADIQKGTMEVAWKNHALNEKLTELVLENERTKNILLARENQITEKSNDLDEKTKELRKEEIIIESRKSDLRRKEQLTNQKDTELETERANIKEREGKSSVAQIEADEALSKCKQLQIELDAEKANIKSLEDETIKKNKDSEIKNAAANSIFERAGKIDEEIKLKEKKFEEEREKIETSLKEKIEEYDRKIEDLKNQTEIVDDIKYDSSKEGTDAKIVVKEAIRIVKNTLSEAKATFDQLDEKYCNGTFKGFSTPIVEIDKCFEELKSQYQQIKEHLPNIPDLASSVSKWIESIEENILKADTSIKSWEFSEAFRNIISGLSTCKNFELLLNILNERSGNNTESENEQKEDEFINWYELFEVDQTATLKQIKKQRNILLNKYHPDKAPEELKEEYNAKTVKIIEAYDILSDVSKRKIFDEKLNQYKQKNK